MKTRNWEDHSDLKTVAEEICKIIDEFDGLQSYIEEQIPKGPNLRSHFNVFGLMDIDNLIACRDEVVRMPFKRNGKYSAFLFKVSVSGTEYQHGTKDAGFASPVLASFEYHDPQFFDKVRDLIEHHAEGAMK
jgi:hypothetical protein